MQNNKLCKPLKYIQHFNCIDICPYIYGISLRRFQSFIQMA